MTGLVYRSSKTYEHVIGLSCCFRQWRAESHCRFLHGYALKVHLAFETENLDGNNWVVDFGSLKPVKAWLEEMFDHKTLVARDDPALEQFTGMQEADLIQINIVEAVGCEAIAKMIFDHVDKWISDRPTGAYLHHVEVHEHGANSASYGHL